MESLNTRPVTLLDVKGDVVRKLIDEAGKRGVEIELLLDRAFFTVECMNLLKGLGLEFIMPCVCKSPGCGGLPREEREAPLLDSRQLEERGVLHHGGLLEREEGDAHTFRDQHRVEERQMSRR